MRQIATLPEEAARTFADYLLTLKIQTQLQPEHDGTAVWVCDEDRVAQARQELTQFTQNPTDERYRGAAPVAESLRQREARLDDEYNRRQAKFQQAMRGSGLRQQPVTLALLAISLFVAVASSTKDTLVGDTHSAILPYLTISSYRFEKIGGQDMVVWTPLDEIRAGQVWRLVTPIFIHFGLLHLFFNMSMLVVIGAAVEARRGSLRFLLLVLFLAITSNLAQHYVGGSIWVKGHLLIRESSPLFGGMSGVLYGLFGYVWMKSRYAPDLGLAMPSQTVFIMLVWFVLCFTGLIGSIANAAHTAGLVVGMLVGYAPELWRRLRPRD